MWEERASVVGPAAAARAFSTRWHLYICMSRVSAGQGSDSFHEGSFPRKLANSYSTLTARRSQ
eukprot:scaffold119699_cov32-Tisochrysis_lutea.AAC.2